MSHDIAMWRSYDAINALSELTVEFSFLFQLVRSSQKLLKKRQSYSR